MILKLKTVLFFLFYNIACASSTVDNAIKITVMMISKTRSLMYLHENQTFIYTYTAAVFDDCLLALVEENISPDYLK